LHLNRRQKREFASNLRISVWHVRTSKLDTAYEVTNSDQAISEIVRLVMVVQTDVAPPLIASHSVGRMSASLISIVLTVAQGHLVLDDVFSPNQTTCLMVPDGR